MSKKVSTPKARSNAVKNALKRAGVSKMNSPKGTPNHGSKSHVVVANCNGKPKSGESERMKKKRASFKARHAKNIKKGPCSAAYWANKVKW